MAKIDWNSPYTPYTWGVHCDICGKEDDPEGANMSWLMLRHWRGDLDICSFTCLYKVGPDTRPAQIPPGYIGGLTRSTGSDTV